MAIEVSCSNCGEEFRVKDDAAGKSFKCKVCGTKISIPEMEDELEDVEEYSSPRRRLRGNDDNRQKRKKKSSSSAVGKTIGPAIGLYVTGGLSLLWGFFLLFVMLTMDAPDPDMPPNAGSAERAGHLIGFYGTLYGLPIMTPLLALATLFGAFCLQTQRVYAMAVIACILASIPCLSPGCVLGMPFGIWGLVMLNQDDVKRAFG